MSAQPMGRIVRLLALWVMALPLLTPSNASADPEPKFAVKTEDLFAMLQFRSIDAVLSSERDVERLREFLAGVCARHSCQLEWGVVLALVSPSPHTHTVWGSVSEIGRLRPECIAKLGNGAMSLCLRYQGRFWALPAGGGHDGVVLRSSAPGTGEHDGYRARGSGDHDNPGAFVRLPVTSVGITHRQGFAHRSFQLPRGVVLSGARQLVATVCAKLTHLRPWTSLQGLVTPRRGCSNLGTRN